MREFLTPSDWLAIFGPKSRPPSTTSNKWLASSLTNSNVSFQRNDDGSGSCVPGKHVYGRISAPPGGQSL